MLRATGKVEFDAANSIVRVTARQSFAGLTDETVDIPFTLLELAYLTSRQLELAKQGVAVPRVELQGGPSAPTDGHAPVPRVGHLKLHTEQSV